MLHLKQVPKIHFSRRCPLFGMGKTLGLRIVRPEHVSSSERCRSLSPGHARDRTDTISQTTHTIIANEFGAGFLEVIASIRDLVRARHLDRDSGWGE